jgi:hypothetical protein
MVLGLQCTYLPVAETKVIAIQPRIIVADGQAVLACPSTAACPCTS